MNNIDDLNESLCSDDELAIDGEWMEKLEAISIRRETAQTLLANAQKNAEDIKEAIYSRVEHDYQQRLALVEQELTPVSAHIRKELTQITGLETDILARLEMIEDLIDEQNFRCKVGEYPEAELAAKIGVLGDLKSRLDEQQAIAQSTYEACEKFLGKGWRDLEDTVLPVESTAQIEFEKSVKLETKLAEEVKPALDSKDLVWADLGTPLAPTASGKAPGEWDSLELERSLEQPVEKSMAEPVSQEQAAVRAELEACLQMINPKGVAERFELSAEGISIGKSTANDVVIKKAGVSRRHARVVLRQPGEYHVQDLSGCGIAVNGLVTEQAILQSGDTLTVGKVDFELITRD